ncbi:hypothetical protein HPP92_021837 [Vanilla planifolia]|uniref:Disease resistance R13L4/SHOC-2-like LRR domain-containing protein n=1 Tax=Vanilla planifolia TaxID=51239 RepID=A0A835PWA4_VANPL|nr:hypothetical protein HPP92_021837 [Vanilla planifolia]
MTAPMESTEQEALYLTIQGFVGDWWNGSGIYPDPCGWTPIQGVSCDLYNGLWYISILNFGPVLDNSLECFSSASFSQFLFKLKHLRSLSFFECFSASQSTILPSTGWENLAGSLETLEFRSNQGLTGEIPIQFGYLTNLQSLVLVDNGFIGRLPQELVNLTSLRRLSLSGNGFTGSIPDSLGQTMTELLILDLSSNSLTGSIPSSIGGLVSLLKLDLNNNLLSGSLPGELGKLKNLTLLDLRNNSLTGGLVQSLQGMASLQNMLLSNNPLGGNLVEFKWENLQHLTNLDLSNMKLTGTIPETIAGLKRLRFLALNNNHLSGTVPPRLADLLSLNALYLNGNNLTGELVFTKDFFERMGKRFASWNNRNLCYRAGSFVPFGVELCSGGEAPDQNPQDKPDGNDGHLVSRLDASFGFQASSTNWSFVVMLVQEVVVFCLLCLFL